MICDKQQTKVYEWEYDWPAEPIPKGWIHKKLSSISECADVVSRASKAYGLIPPVVVAGAPICSAYYSFDEHIISLPEWAWNSSTVLHETAHAINGVLNFVDGEPFSEDAHGGNFVQIMLELFSIEMGWDIRFLMRSVKERGIQVSKNRINRPPKDGKTKKLNLEKMRHSMPARISLLRAIRQRFGWLASEACARRMIDEMLNKKMITSRALAARLDWWR